MSHKYQTKQKTCKNCGKIFTSYLRGSGWTMYCTPACYRLTFSSDARKKNSW